MYPQLAPLPLALQHPHSLPQLPHNGPRVGEILLAYKKLDQLLSELYPWRVLFYLFHFPYPFLILVTERLI